MNTSDPNTWTDWTVHPTFIKYEFNDQWIEWYGGGDPTEDLRQLRECALAFRSRLLNLNVELTMLDDATTFVAFQLNNVEGQFGIGCEENTFYIHIDANPNENDALETELDNLNQAQMIDFACKFIVDAK